jgi:hypothetical protein
VAPNVPPMTINMPTKLKYSPAFPWMKNPEQKRITLMTNPIRLFRSMLQAVEAFFRNLGGRRNLKKRIFFLLSFYMRFTSDQNRTYSRSIAGKFGAVIQGLRYVPPFPVCFKVFLG